MQRNALTIEKSVSFFELLRFLESAGAEYIIHLESDLTKHLSSGIRFFDAI